MDLLADYLPWVQVVDFPGPPHKVLRCRNPSDVPFLHLAVTGKARALVSGDRDLSGLTRASTTCPIPSVDAFCRLHPGD